MACHGQRATLPFLLEKTIPISAKENEIRVNKIQYIPIKLDQEEIKMLQQEDPKYSGKLSLDLQGVIYKKKQNYGKKLWH